MVGKTAAKSKSTASTIVVPFCILGLDKIFLSRSILHLMVFTEFYAVFKNHIHMFNFKTIKRMKIATSRYYHQYTKYSGNSSISLNIID
jgi:mannose/fructose/N-acetylgalactosamine-specific phosphotransferase system component IIC